MKFELKLSILAIAIASALPSYAANSFVGSEDGLIDGDYSISDVTGTLTLSYTDGSKAYGRFGIYPGGHQIEFTGNNILVNVNATGQKATDESDYQAYGIYASSSVDKTSNLVLGTSASNMVRLDVTGDSATVGINVQTGSTVTLNSNTINLKTLSNKDGYSTAIGAYGAESKVNLSGEFIDISSQSINGNARALEISDGAIVNIGSQNTKTINITSLGDAESMGLFTLKGGVINLESQTVNITTNGRYGLLAQNNTELENAPDNTSKIVINSDSTVVNSENSDGAGIMAFSNGYVEINGDLTVNAATAIDTRGNATVNINQKGDGTVVLNGDIVFETPGPSQNSGNVINSNVNINLTGSDSSWTGALVKMYPEKNKDNENYTKVEDFSLKLVDGAKWNATVYNGSTPSGGILEEQAVNNLTMDGGVINASQADQQINVENLTLTDNGALFTAPAELKEDGHLQSAKLSATTLTKSDNSHFSVFYSGISADQITNENASDLAAVSLDGVALSETAPEGDIKGTWNRLTNSNGVSTTSFAENTKLASFRGLNAAALVAWRDEVAYTNQRMEFLRDNSHAYGAWAQVYGGESKYEDKAELTTTTVQVGADTTIGDWVAGAAFSYMTGEADLLRGDADTDAYTLSLYAERSFDSGLFVNGLARYGRLSTDATAGNMDASYDNNAFSLGGNVGYRFTFAQQAFVEPNFGLQYAYVMGDDYKASNGVKVEQDDFDALIASVGARVGFNFPNNAGKLFARASVNHDFLGEIDGTASKANLAESMYMDLGGTWVTYGVGTQFNITDNLSVWGNVDRTTGGEVSTNYMMNAGLRYVF